MLSWKHLGVALIACPLVFGLGTAHAGGTITFGDNKFISLGAGARASFAAKEDAAPSGDNWSNDFNVDNARIYISGQVNDYIKLEFNTDCVFCGSSSLGKFALLDLIAKLELTPWFNLWGGRLIVPAERQELNGPFYSSTHDAYKTPFYPSDFSVNYGTGGAGVYARDHGVNLWGAVGPEGALQYVFGVFAGLQSASNFGPNQKDNPLFAGRVAYNFLSVEKNPGYYTSGTYYGGGGDIFTLGVASQYQEDGSGSFAHPGDFFGVSGDALLELNLPNQGVVTVNGEFKYFSADYDQAAFADADVFPMFDGNSYSIAALYLFPQVVGIGKFQPYGRYTGVQPDKSADRDELEFGLNYIIDGHNARASLFYQYGDIATKGLDYSPGASGDSISAIKLAVQIQL